MNHAGSIAVFWLVGLAATTSLYGQDPQELQKLLSLFQQTQTEAAKGNYDAALGPARESITLAERSFVALPALAAGAHANLSDLCLLMNRPEEAEAAARKAVAAGTRQRDVPAWMQGRFRIALAKALAKQGKFAEGEPLIKATIADNDAGPAPDVPQRVEGWVAAANFYCDQGRFEEAASYMRRCLDIYLRMFGTDDPTTLTLMEQCVQILNATGRKPETETMSRKLVDAYARSKSPDPISYARVLEHFAGFYLVQNRVEDGLPLLLKALEVREQALGPRHPAVYDTLFALAGVYRGEGNRAELDRLRERLKDAPQNSTAATPGERSVGETGRLVMELGDLDLEAALPRLKRLAEEEERVYGADSPAIVPTLLIVALFRSMLSPPQETEQLFARIEAITKAHPERCFTEQCALDALRAQYAWAQGRKREAADLLEDTLRRRLRPAVAAGTGTSFDRAQVLNSLAGDGRILVGWLWELKDVEGMFRATELLRGRVMLEQIRARNIDLYAGLPPDEAQRSRERLGAAFYRMNVTQAEVNRLAGEKASQAERDHAQEQADEARADFVAVYREVLNAGAVAKLNWNEETPTTADRMQHWAEQSKGIVLHYSVFDDAAFLIAFAAGAKPRGYQLALPPDVAKTLEVPSGLPYADTGEGLESAEGRQKFNRLLERMRKERPDLKPQPVAEPYPLTGRRLHSAFENKARTGVLQLLADDARHAELVPKLAALACTLLPPDVVGDLRSGKFTVATIVTDGLLTLLPFEALVLTAGDAPEYLLDSGPPIAYASSATLLLNLAAREEKPTGKQRAPLLTVADPVYTLPTEATSGVDSATASRSMFPGGAPAAIPHSGQESQWLESVFNENGFEVGCLRGADALERWVHDASDNRKILHLACHGYVDRRYGNLFGALALGPGENAAIDPQDDGMLTLSEISRLDLRGTELAVLSACQTNVGPVQFGEGTSGISRSFLVAGARRVVASNWLVDDEATASQISYYGSILASAMKEGKSIDYAAALQEAKRWTKSQDKWRHPYYWAVFTHVGPN